MRSGILAVVLLGMATIVVAQAVEESGLPPAPVLLGEAEDETPVAVRLESYEASIRIHGFLAETTIVMSFFNPDSRELAGEFVFALPEGATVSGYGLDVEGVMVDGVAVEKHKARIAFERESRKRVDPGLVEWLGGSLFRTRVYPILGESRRLIKVQYVSELQIREGRASYSLPLAHLPPLERLKVDVDVFGAESPPVIYSHPFTELEFASYGDRHTSTAQSEQIHPAQDLELTSFFPSATTVMVDEYGEGEYAFALANVLETDLAMRRRRSPPKRVAILWDASFSRADSDHSAVIDLLESVLGRWWPREVLLTVFRDKREAPREFRIRKGRSEELIDALASVTYDGATRTAYDFFERPPGFRADAFILVSDGRVTLGEMSLSSFEKPVFTVSASAHADHTLLRYIAKWSGGFYANLSQDSLTYAADGFAFVPLALVDVQVLEGAAYSMSAPIGRPIPGPTLMSGLLGTETARLRIQYGYGGRVARSVDVTIRGGTGPDMVGRFWAQNQVGELLVFQEEYLRKEILELGRKHGLVTPYTSLMVLETLDQYLEYGIEPPATLPEMRREYLLEIGYLEEEARDIESEHLNLLKSKWAEFLDPTAEASPPVPAAESRRERRRVRPEPDRPPLSPEEQAARERAIEEALAQAFEAEVAVHGAVLSRWEVEALTPRSVDIVDSGEASDGDIVIQPWNPETPYLDTLELTPEAELYQTYLGLRKEYGSSPGFYVDCARFLFLREQPRLAFRVLSTLLDLGIEEPRFIRIAAMLYQEHGDLDTAIELLEKLTQLLPELPQMERQLALAQAARARTDAETGSISTRCDLGCSIDLLVQAVLEPWGSVADRFEAMYLFDSRFADVGRIALVDLFWLAQRYEEQCGGSRDRVDELRLEFDGEIEADLRVVLEWDADYVDVDLWVIEPSGEKVYFRNKVSKSGGLMSRDCVDGFGPESYFNRSAPPGSYRIVAKYFSEDGPEMVGPVTVQATVFTDFGRRTEKMEVRTVRLEEEKDEFEIAVVTVE